jgi:hypothetical protein
MSEIDEWRLKRARGVVLEYMRGIKPRATLQWAIGCLTKSFGLSEGEINTLIESIKRDPTIIMTEERLNKIEVLKRAIEEGREK